jgi:hypothetical protein
MIVRRSTHRRILEHVHDAHRRELGRTQDTLSAANERNATLHADLTAAQARIAALEAEAAERYHAVFHDEAQAWHAAHRLGSEVIADPELTRWFVPLSARHIPRLTTLTLLSR